MLKSFLLFISVILLLSSGAYASIGHTKGFSIGNCTTINQAEDFSIGAFNMVKRFGGAGRAEGGNIVTVGQRQETQAAGTKAIQQETGDLTQNASAVGLCGHTNIKVLQDASVEGLQGQIVEGGRHRPSMREQGQGLTVGLDNVIRKSGGVGRAVGEQGFVGEQHQTIVNPSGTSENTQIVDVEQYASVKGGPCSNVEVKNSVDVNMGQWQNVSSCPVPPKPCPPSPPCGDP